MINNFEQHLAESRGMPRSRTDYMLYGGKNMIWFKPHVGDYFYFYCDPWNDGNILEYVVKVTKVDDRISHIYFIGHDIKNNEVEPIDHCLGDRDYIYRKPTKQEKDRLDKLLRIKKFDL